MPTFHTAQNSQFNPYTRGNNNQAYPTPAIVEPFVPPAPVVVTVPLTSANKTTSVTDNFFRNTGATFQGATTGFINLISEPLRKIWNYSKEGTRQGLTVTGGAVVLGYVAVATASAGTLFPFIAGCLAIGAGVQLCRGGYAVFSGESPKEQLKGFNKIGQALTLSVLAGVSLLHYEKFWHAPAWDKLLPSLGNGIKETARKGLNFLKALPANGKGVFINSKDWVVGVKNNTVAFFDNLINPKKMH